MSRDRARRQARPGTVVLFGPTASGKSDLAVRLAERHGGTVVNADSMQLYRDLRILTARPDPAMEGRVPHRLYGVLAPWEIGSAGDWLERVASVLAEVRADGRVPIVVGGTGLYVRALLDGLAPVPPIPGPVREKVRRLAQDAGAGGLLRCLAECDPQGVAAAPVAGDPQRLMRALEVVLGTGRPLRAWQNEVPVRIDLPPPVVRLALAPARGDLHARIEGRLRAMIGEGALAEVQALRRLGVERSHPVTKAVAVRELLAYLDGAVDLATALQRATTQTRRYAKRQFTWLRHRMPDFEVVPSFGETVPLDWPGPWLGPAEALPAGGCVLTPGAGRARG